MTEDEIGRQAEIECRKDQTHKIEVKDDSKDVQSPRINIEDVNQVQVALKVMIR
jgi:hypothetical protein